MAHHVLFLATTLIRLPCLAVATWQSDARVRSLDASLASLRAELERERSSAASSLGELEREVRRQAERAEAAAGALAGAERQLEGVTAARELGLGVEGTAGKRKGG